MFRVLVVDDHLATLQLVRSALESEDMDFITGICSYANRQPNGPGSFMLPPESFPLHRKLLWTEEDALT